MDKIKNYDISFSGLKVGKHEFQFKVEQSFLELFDTEREFEQPNVIADVVLQKHSTFLEFEIKIHGTVELVCDISSEKFNEEIENQINFLVKFGEEYDDSNEELIVIPREDHDFNIAQLLYECIMLAIPMKKVSPNLSDEDLALLEKYSPEGQSEKDDDDEDDIDPRWSALKNLK